MQNILPTHHARTIARQPTTHRTMPTICLPDTFRRLLTGMCYRPSCNSRRKSTHLTLCVGRYPSDDSWTTNENPPLPPDRRDDGLQDVIAVSNGSTLAGDVVERDVICTSIPTTTTTTKSGPTCQPTVPSGQGKWYVITQVTYPNGQSKTATDIIPADEYSCGKLRQYDFTSSPPFQIPDSAADPSTWTKHFVVGNTNGICTTDGIDLKLRCDNTYLAKDTGVSSAKASCDIKSLPAELNCDGGNFRYSAFLSCTGAICGAHTGTR
jgi:hypothetical protein